jgi:predicted methyltransferase
VDEFDNRISHFELYQQAMHQMGASTVAIENLIQGIHSGKSIEQAISEIDCANSIKDFLNFTFKIVNHAPAHVQAAVFTFGREDLIPDMFTRLLEKLVAETPETVSIFKYYIERHIEVDGGHHSHLALEMVSELCGQDAAKWKEAEQASIEALQIRAKLWDAVLA